MPLRPLVATAEGGAASIELDWLGRRKLAVRGAGRDVLAGRSPFPPATRAALAGGTAFVYPPLAAFLVAPFALVPLGAADWLFTGMLVLAVLATLRVCGVRDWRVYGAAFLWPPVFSSIQAGTLSL